MHGNEFRRAPLTDIRCPYAPRISFIQFFTDCRNICFLFLFLISLLLYDSYVGNPAGKKKVPFMHSIATQDRHFLSGKISNADITVNSIFTILGKRISPSSQLSPLHNDAPHSAHGRSRRHGDVHGDRSGRQDHIQDFLRQALLPLRQQNPERRHKA